MVSLCNVGEWQMSISSGDEGNVFTSQALAAQNIENGITKRLGYRVGGCRMVGGRYFKIQPT